MYIDEEKANLEEPRTLKISLPARLHLKLHSLKILSGTNISETVEDALVAYLEDDELQVEPGVEGSD